MDNLYYFYGVLALIALGAVFLEHFGVVAEDEQRKNKRKVITTHSIKKNK